MNLRKLLTLVVSAPFVLAACTSQGQPAPLPTAPATVVGGVQATQAEATVKMMVDPQLGNILTDAKGMTLYRYTRDGENVSTCYDQCAANWPPLLTTSTQPTLAEGIPGQLGVVTRRDGAMQVSYNGMPLYHWINDRNPGDTTGQGIGDVWFVVQPVEAESTGTTTE